MYVLFTEKYNKIYVGYTSDLEDRMQSHNHLATKGYTIKFRPWEILFTEEFLSKSDKEFISNTCWRCSIHPFFVINSSKKNYSIIFKDIDLKSGYFS